VSSANFGYGASLSVLAFAYLAGISSINGALVAGMLLSALVPTTSNYFFADTNIDSYIGLLSGLGIIVTAIVHPEGVAPFFSGAVRHLGDWLVGALPGAETLRSNYRGPKHVTVKAGLGVLVVGTALWLYNAKFVESVELWVLISAALLFVVVLGFARFVGPVSPTFPEAGRQLADVGRRLGPSALVGYVIGWLIWPLRVDTYSKLWMPILGAMLTLMIGSIARQVIAGRRADADARTNDPTTQADTTASALNPTPAEVN